jgi:hypothetical protein
VLGLRAGVKSPTLDGRWPEDMFINGDNPHLTSRFCRVELSLTQILRGSKMHANTFSIERKCYICSQTGLAFQRGKNTGIYHYPIYCDYIFTQFTIVPSLVCDLSLNYWYCPSLAC